VNAEILREAAALMRDQASATEPGPWHAALGGYVEASCGANLADTWGQRRTATHIASWHPAVALAVADWLTVTAWWLDDEWPDDPDAPMDWSSSTGDTAERVKAALAVARAYLGGDE